MEENCGTHAVPLNEPTHKQLWDNFKKSNIRLIGVPEGEEKEQEIGHLFEKNNERKFPYLVKEIHIQVQEAQRIPNNMDAKRPTPKHIIIKMPKVNGRES